MSDGLFVVVVLIVCAAVLVGCEVWKWWEEQQRNKELRDMANGRQR